MADVKTLENNRALSSALKWVTFSSPPLTRKFILGLIQRIKSYSLIDKLIHILSSFSQKDFVYSRSQCRSSLINHENISLYEEFTPSKEAWTFMSKMWNWFQTMNAATQSVILCGIIDSTKDVSILSEAHNLLKVMSSQMRLDTDELEIASDELCESTYSFNTDQHPDLYLLAATSPCYQQKGNLFQDESKKSLFISLGLIFIEYLRRIGHKRSTNKRNENIALSFEWNILQERFHRKLARALGKGNTAKCFNIYLVSCDPVFHVDMLDKKSMLVSKLVSRHWNKLIYQVSVEKFIQQEIREEAVMMQGVSVNGADTSYARKLKVAIPLSPQPNPDIDMKFMHEFSEERNIYCGAYNVLILDKEFNTKRRVHFCEGNKVATGSSDGVIKILDAASGQLLHAPIRGHPGALTSIHIQNGEKVVIYSGSYDTTIRRWHVGSSACKQIMYGHTCSIVCLDMFDNLLVSGSKDGLVKVWDTTLGKCVCTFRHAKRGVVKSVKIRGDVIVSSCDRGYVKVWNLKTRLMFKVLSGHKSEVSCVSMDDNFIVSGSHDGYILSWTKDTPYKKHLRAFRHPKEVLCVQLAYLRIVSGCADGKIRVLNLLTGECLRVIRGNSNCDPILSLHGTTDRLVVNLVSNLLLLQFEDVEWVYSKDEEVKKRQQTSTNRENRPFSAPADRSFAGSPLVSKPLRKVRSAVSQISHQREPSARLRRRLSSQLNGRVQSAVSVPGVAGGGIQSYNSSISSCIVSTFSQEHIEAPKSPAVTRPHSSYHSNQLPRNHGNRPRSCHSNQSPSALGKSRPLSCHSNPSPGQHSSKLNRPKSLRTTNGTYLKIGNLHHISGDSSENVCTVINAAPTDTRELLYRKLQKSTPELEKWVSQLKPSDFYSQKN